MSVFGKALLFILVSAKRSGHRPAFTANGVIMSSGVFTKMHLFVGALLVILGFFAAIFKQKFGNIPRKRSVGVASLGVIVFFAGAIIGIGGQERKNSAGINNAGSVIGKSAKMKR